MDIFNEECTRGNMMEKLLQILPIIITAESFLAGGYLIIQGNIGSGLYWLSAGVLNFSVIFLIKQFG